MVKDTYSGNKSVQNCGRMNRMNRIFYLIKAIAQTFLAIVGSLYYYARGIILWVMPRSYRREKIEDDTVLVTGGGSGIGRLLCINLAAYGAKVVSWDINEKGNEETKEMIEANGGKCHIFTVNICNRHQVYNAAKLVKEQVGKVDILINNAGIVNGKNLLDTSDDEILKTFDVNILSHFWTTKAFLPDMMTSNKGHIVTIASVAGIVGTNKLIDYSASKFAAVGFNEALRMELSTDKYKGIHTTLICPYYTNTGMFDGVRSRLVSIMKPEFVAKEITDSILMRDRFLIMPFILRFILAFKGLMPTRTVRKVFLAITGDQALSELKSNNNDPV